jgi:hypothetical protein
VREGRKEEMWRRTLACGGGEVDELVGLLGGVGDDERPGCRRVLGQLVPSVGAQA